MINEIQLKELQKHWINWPHKENASFSDAIYEEMLDTIEALYKENAHLKEKLENAEVDYGYDDSYYGVLDCGCDGNGC